MGRSTRSARALCLGAALLGGCQYQIPEPALHPPTIEGLTEADARRSAPPGTRTALPPATFKVHLHNGDVMILTNVTVDSARNIVGVGARFDTTRTRVGPTRVRQQIALDSVALIESDDPSTAVSFSAGLYQVWVVAYGAYTGSCVLDPKSCFGSCPTFYVDGEDSSRPRAEGFSSSIARRLEATDIDDLELVRPGGSTVGLRMLNEAWETHSVRWVRLHAVPTVPGATVLARHGGGFQEATAIRGPARCVAAGGDCRSAVAARDGSTWHDATDPEDLATPDTMLLTFTNAGSEPQGLLLAARQSFVSTFVLYQSMAWLGGDAGEWLARLERGDARALAALLTVERLIGAIDVQAERVDGSWHNVARFDEHGPIATDRQLIELPRWEGGATRRLRLIYAKGNWRVDQAALATLGDARSAVTLNATDARRSGPHAGDVRAALADTSTYTVTFPGDSIAMRFALPESAPAYALFLESRGYYLEWQRGEWLAEGNVAMADLVMHSPREALRRMAPMYKTREANFESMFWASRFGGGR